MIWKRYCGTAAKAGGNGENKLLPVVTGVSCLLENDGIMGFGKMVYWVIGKVPLGMGIKLINGVLILKPILLKKVF